MSIYFLDKYTHSHFLELDVLPELFLKDFLSHSLFIKKLLTNKSSCKSKFES